MVAGKTNVILGGITRIVQSPEKKKEKKKKNSDNLLFGNGQMIAK